MTGIVSIAAGDTFAVAVDKDGYVWTWGNNNVGQLGIGASDSANHTFAVRVLKGEQSSADAEERYLSGIKAIAAGGNYVGGQGGDFAGAVDENGYVYAWGSNAYGQLGFAATTNRNTPVRVLAGASAAGKAQTNFAYDGYLRNVVALSAGDGYMLALLDNSSVVAWGRNVTKTAGDGQQLGTEYNYNTMIALPVVRGNNPAGRDMDHVNESRFIRQVTDVDAGRQVSVFQTVETSQSGYVKGYALLTGSIKPHNYTAEEYHWDRPTVVTADLVTKEADRSNVAGAIADVYQVAAGGDNVLMMTGPKPNGIVWGMGVNTDGQLAQAYTTAQNTITKEHDDTVGPVKLQAPQAQQPVDSRDPVYMTNNAAVATGDNTTYLYQTDGTVYAVGRGINGQLGDTTVASKNLPVQTGQGNKLSVKAVTGTLTQGTTTATYDLTQGKALPDFIAMGVTDTLTISANAAGTKLQQSNGFNLYRDAYYTDVPAGGKVVYTLSDLTIGTFNSTVNTDGTAAGATITVSSADPTKFGATDLTITVFDSAGNKVASGVTRITFMENSKATNSAVATGVNHSVALAEDGTLWVWGDNREGQLGLSDAQGAYKTIEYREYPAHLDIKSGSAAVKFTGVAAGDTYTLAIAADGTLWGFGGGYGDENGAPAPVVGITDKIAQIAVYNDRAIALTVGGKVLTWTDGKAEEVTEVAGLAAVHQVAVGAEHFMALADYTEAAGGTVYTWGGNTWGQLGAGARRSNAAAGATVNVVDASTGRLVAGDAAASYSSARRSMAGDYLVPAAVAADDARYTTPAPAAVETWDGFQKALTYVSVNGTQFAYTDLVTEVQTGTQQVQQTDGNGRLLFTIQKADGSSVAAYQKSGQYYAVADDSEIVLEVDDTAEPVMSTVPVHGLPTGPSASKPLSGIRSIAAGGYTSAAVTTDGKVYTWGKNNAYQAGVGDYFVTADISNNPLVNANGEATPVLARANLNSTAYGSIIQPTLMKTADGAELSGVSYVVLGDSHGMAVLEDKGAVYAWGLNHKGQTGVGLDDSTHTNTGAGNNNEGQWGSVNPENDAYYIRTASPVARGDSFNANAENTFQGVLAVAAGATHSLMIRADGFVFATGSNEGYKLGTATVYENTVSASNGFITGTPVQVGDLESKGMAIYKASVYTVADDGTETFARPVIFDPTTGMTADGTVAQLTIAANEVAKVDYSKQDTDPALVEVFLSGFNLLVNSRGLSMRAADADSVQWTSGDDTVATVAEANKVATMTPVEGHTGVTLIRVTNPVSGHTGSLRLTVTQEIHTDIRVAPMIATGLNFSAVLKSDGTVWAWGNNDYGQLGDGTHITRTMPTQVQLQNLSETGRQYIGNVVAIAAGANHLVMLTDKGEVYTTGDNSKGQLGYASEPTYIEDADGNATEDIDTAVPYKNDYATKVVFKDEAGEVLENQPFFTAVATGYNHTLALTRGAETVRYTAGGTETVYTGGEVWAWGANNNYQLGRGTAVGTEHSSEPQKVVKGQSASDTDYLGSITAIAAGHYNSFAIRGDGYVLAWGRNDHGQLGDSTKDDRGMPVLMLAGMSASTDPYLRNAYMVSAGLTHTMILVRVDHPTLPGYVRSEVYTVGDNTYGQLGAWSMDHFGTAVTNNHEYVDYSSTTPVRVLADPSTTNSHDWFGSTYDAPVGGDNIVLVAVFAGEYQSYALDQSGKLYAWGRNQYGQLGITTVDDTAKAANSENILPTQVLAGLSVSYTDDNYDVAMTNLRTAAGSYNHVIALKDDGTVWGWGQNNDWKLGDNLTNRAVPVGSYIYTGYEDVSLDPTAYDPDHVHRIGDAQRRYLPTFSDPDGVTVNLDATHTYPVRVGEVEETLMMISDDANTTHGVERDPVIGDAAVVYNAGTEIIRLRDDQIALIYVDDIKKQYMSGFDLLKRNGAEDVFAGLTLSALTWKMTDKRFGVISKDTAKNAIVFTPSTTTMGSTMVEISYTAADGKVYSMLVKLFVSRRTSVTDEQRVRRDVATPAIDAGYAHTVSLKADGTVWTWGYGGMGQLGDGTSNSFSYPIPVLRGEQEVYYYCPDLTCGELIPHSAFKGTPVKDAEGNTVADADGNVIYGAPYTYTCDCGAVLDRDTLENTGDTLHHIVAVSAGYAYTLALDMWGNVWAWGASPVANGGFVTKVDFSKSYDEDYYYGNAIPSTPAAGDEGENVIIVDISAGKDHAVALDSNGTLWAWGNDGFGQLGIDAASYEDANGDNIDKWSWGINYSSAVSTHDLWRSYYGWDQSFTRLREDLFYNLMISEADKLSARDTVSVPTHVVRGEAAVRGINSNVGYRYLDHIVAIEAGDYYTMALRSDGTVYVWGKNDMAQLGRGTVASGNAKTTKSDRLDRYVPTKVAGLSGVVDLAAGHSHLLALTNEGKVYAWGQTYVYQDYPCGTVYADSRNWSNCSDKDGNNEYFPHYYYENHSTPVEVVLGDVGEVVSVSAGNNSGYALVVDEANGTSGVYTWGGKFLGSRADGANAAGNYGSGGTVVDRWSSEARDTVPADGTGDITRVHSGEGPYTTVDAVRYLDHVTAVTAGNNTAFFLTEDGYVYGVGSNSSGQTGNLATGGTMHSDGLSIGEPALVGAQAGNLLQITTGELTATTSTDANAVKNPANDSRGRAQYFATAADDANPAIYMGKLPVDVHMTVGQILTVDAKSIVEETYKGYNLHWDHTIRDKNTAVEEGEAANEADYADRFTYFSSDESIVRVENVVEGGKNVGMKITPTGQIAGEHYARYGTATIVVVDKVNGYWGSFKVTVVGEGTNEDGDAIVSVERVYTGYNTSYAIKRNGTVWAWGDNRNGNLGLSTQSSDVTQEAAKSPAGFFTWKFYPADPYVPGATGAMDQAIQDAQAAIGDASDPASLESVANAASIVLKNAQNALDQADWVNSRDTLIAAIGTLETQTQTAKDVIDQSVATFNAYAGIDVVDMLIEKLTDSKTGLKAELDARVAAYRLTRTQLQGMGDNPTKEEFGDLMSNLATLASSLTAIQGRIDALTGVSGELTKDDSITDYTAITGVDITGDQPVFPAGMRLRTQFEYTLRYDMNGKVVGNTVLDTLSSANTAMEALDELLNSSSDFSAAVAAADQQRGLDAGRFQTLRANLDIAQSAYLKARADLEPYKNTIAFYQAMIDTLRDKNDPTDSTAYDNRYPGVAVITGLTAQGRAASELILPTTLTESDYTTVFSSNTLTLLSGVASLPVFLVDYEADNAGNQFADGKATTLTISEGYKVIRVGAFQNSKLQTINFNTDIPASNAMLASSFTADAYTTAPYASSALRRVNITLERVKDEAGNDTLSSERLQKLRESGIFTGANVTLVGAEPPAEVDDSKERDSVRIITPTQVAGVEGQGRLGAGTYHNPAIMKMSVNQSYQESNGAGGHTLAVDAYGNVYAWGYNSYGQIGSGNTDYYKYPTRVLAGDSPYWYVMGSDERRYYTDGAQGYYVDNEDHTRTHINTVANLPAGVTLGEARYLTGVVDVAAGYDHSLALLKDGTVLAWGNTYRGQAGDPNNGVARSLAPQFVRQAGSVGEGYWLNNAISVSASGTSAVEGASAILRSDGKVFAWGSNAKQLLGNTTGRGIMGATVFRPIWTGSPQRGRWTIPSRVRTASPSILTKTRKMWLSM